jgi:hypothetical protein
VQAKRLVAAAVGIAVLAGAAPARAHPGYPAIVDDTFSVDITKCLAPQGCQLCHTDSGGGTGLRPFGQRLVSTYGLDSNASTEDDNSLRLALSGLKSGDPLLVTDLQKCIDPNSDVPNDPLPQYGCSTAARMPVAEGESAGPLAALALLAAAALVRARRGAARTR